MHSLLLWQLKRKGKRLQKEYQITVLSALETRARLQSPYWEKNEALLKDLKKLMEAQPEVTSVTITPAIGTITIQFEKPAELDPARIENLEEELVEIHRKNGVILDE